MNVSKSNEIKNPVTFGFHNFSWQKQITSYDFSYFAHSWLTWGNTTEKAKYSS